MPRSNRPKRSKRDVEFEEIDLNRVRGGKRSEIKRGVEYTVQPTTGANAEVGKSWTCPYCQLQIEIGTSHLVAWDELRGVESRRHFHNGCWTKFQGPLI